MGDRKKLQKIVDDINKKNPVEGRPGRSVIQFGSDVQPVHAIPSGSPALSYVLGIGGWPRGKLVEIFGKEHSGKTTLTIQALRDVYDHEQGKRVVAYIDLEHSFDPKWARTLGLRVDDELLHITPENAEQGIDIAYTLAKSDEVCAIAWDSVGATMAAKAHATFEEREVAMAATAGPMTRFVNMMAPVADFHDCTVFILNQVRADLSGSRHPMIKTPGGHALKHMASVRLYLRGSEKYKDRLPGYDEPVEVGYRMFFTTKKNKFAPPYREGSSDFYFVPNQFCDHVGFDIEGDIAALGMTLGIVSRSGAWYEWEGVRGQGREKFFAELKTAGKTGALDEAVRAAMLEGQAPSVKAVEGPEEVAPDGPDLGPQDAED